MAILKKEFSDYIKHFKFKELFNEMGWDQDRTTQPVVVDSIPYQLNAVAQKSGFKILKCYPSTDGNIPDTATRKKIEIKVTKLFQEHLIIFFDTKQTEQIWQLVVREPGKLSKVTETRYHINQDPELLFQRASGIFFVLDEEEHITIVDVTKRIADNFHQNTEKVVKRFYTEFSNHHKSFYEFVSGMDDHIDALNKNKKEKDDNRNKQWYVSLMLNRLMFCYFIQKKGFLDNNKHYLREKLQLCQSKKGKDKFYSFYRNFLLELFHEGLGSPDHKKKLEEEIGKIPYLNGGLFDEHELEKQFEEIQINDKAFEGIFDFFDQWNWHLDTGIAATGKDINPDVIGYIFEKYINDRANMGAYYTKEDITDYISKNSILPYVFDETKRQYPKAFNADAELWTSVKNSSDTYIYEAIKKGVELPVPDEVSAGIKEVSKRTEWNKPAPPEYALPTEIWREVIDRRNRYTEVKTKIEKGEIAEINDFITYNLNIRQLAQDIVENTTDPEFLRHFYKSLNSVTIIDPTCGSGAFLFAAMNILEPLYESCLQRMRNFIEDEDRLNSDNKKTFNHKYKYFREVLEETQNEKHPNLQYFIYKSIILRNLYGVDIMKEAVEIAKLRLFLKLVATVDADYRKPNLGLEPLPDIDFNIRAGNTLIGFATEAELKRGLNYTLDGRAVAPVIEEKCDVVAKTFARYKEIQLSYGDNFKDFKSAKEELNKRLKELNHELNQLLHKQASSIKYETWLQSHQPFHWFAEFYEIIHDKGGFDVIIGNPPYVEYSLKSKAPYIIKNYSTIDCGNLYAFITERAISICNEKSLLSFIIPSASICTPRMNNMIKVVQNRFKDAWISVWDERPAKLFEGVDQQLSIHIYSGLAVKNNKLYITPMLHWKSNSRDTIFDNLSYYNSNASLRIAQVIPKIENQIERKILEKLEETDSLQYFSQGYNLNSIIYYRNAGGRYWRLIKSFPSYFKSSKGVSTTSTEKTIKVNSEHTLLLAALYSSNLFYWFWRVVSNCRHLTDREFLAFKIPTFIFNNDELKIQLSQLATKYEESLLVNSKRLSTINKNSGATEQDVFTVNLSKPIIDKIDKVLAAHYGFTDEELDFIINYDIKYRMGKELEGEEE